MKFFPRTGCFILLELTRSTSFILLDFSMFSGVNNILNKETT